MWFFKKKTAQNDEQKTSREIDRERVAQLNTKSKKSVKVKTKRKIKRTVIDTLPYERFVSEYVMLLKSNIKIGRETANLYSQTYHISDINYSALTETEQEEMQAIYSNLLNGFDKTVSLQVTLHNNKINKKDFEKRVLLAERDDGFNEERGEFNGILHDKLMLGQNGVQCQKYITITVCAVNLETAQSRFLNYGNHLTKCLKKLGSTPTLLRRNQRIRLLADIFRDVNTEISSISSGEFARCTEKTLCCPDYFDFQIDYFMWGKKYARCIYFMRLPENMLDTIFKDLVETNLSVIITKNVEFVPPETSMKIIRGQITNMQMEQINRTKKAAESGVYIDPVAGTSLAEDYEEAQQFMQKLKGRNQKMMLCQFIIMLTADSFNELEEDTEALKLILDRYIITPCESPYRQEIAMASCLPVGNSFSVDKKTNLQVRRTLSTESTAVFCPFNAMDLVHQGGLYYGLSQMTHNIILFNRLLLNNPNGFILGVPGSGKSFTAKLEIIYTILGTKDEILIVDPEREYTPLVELFGGEIIYISETSNTHINPLDLTENPDPIKNPEYDPIKAKFDFLQSFFSVILGNRDLDPTERNIIDVVMRKMYSKHKNPTLVEFYAVLENYEKQNSGGTASTAAYLKESLHLYVKGSLNVFSNKSNVNINKRIVVYDIKDLGTNLQTLGMMIVLENLWDKIAKNRAKGLYTRVYIDEFYLLFKSEQTAEFFYKLYKRARKWGGIPTGITQNVEDLLRSETARAMLANTEFIIMLSQNSTDRDILAQLLKISPETMNYVTNSGQGSGIIYAANFGAIPFYNEFPPGNLYNKITTKFSEVTAMDVKAELEKSAVKKADSEIK